MDPALLAALVTLGGSIGLGAMNSTGSKKSQKRAYEYNMRMMNAQNAEQQRLIEQMQYLTAPKYERSRIEEAGLNVGLMYDKGGTMGGASVPQPPATPGFGPSSTFTGYQMPGDFGSLLTQGLAGMTKTEKEKTKADTRAADASAVKAQADAMKTAGVDTEKAREEIEKLKREQEGIEADTKLKKLNQEKVEIENKIANISLEIQEATKGAQKKSINLQVKQLKGNIKRIHAELEQALHTNKINKETYDEQVETIMEQLYILRNQAIISGNEREISDKATGAEIAYYEKEEEKNKRAGELEKEINKYAVPRYLVATIDKILEWAGTIFGGIKALRPQSKGGITINNAIKGGTQ